MRRRTTALLSVALISTLALGSLLYNPDPAIGEQGIVNAQPDHIVIVVEENHAYRQIVGNASAPYMNELFHKGTSLTNHYAVGHPSQPNYLALFSGSTQGVKDDLTPKKSFRTDNLASQLIGGGLTFAGYSEGLPKTGYKGPYDLKTGYARKHNPWVNFTNVPAESNLSFSSFPRDYAKLPTVSFVIPNMKHDIHDGTIKEADDWLKSNLSGYINWAMKHNSMLILTWDEDDYSGDNKIPTVLVGPMVKAGKVTQKTNHYSVLRLIEELYGLPYAGHSKQAPAIPMTSFQPIEARLPRMDGTDGLETGEGNTTSAGS